MRTALGEAAVLAHTAHRGIYKSQRWKAVSTEIELYEHVQLSSQSFHFTQKVRAEASVAINIT